MNRIWRLLGVVGVVAALSGCASNDYQDCSQKGLSNLLAATDLPRVFDSVALAFCTPGCDPAQAPERFACDEQPFSKLVLVPDFVNVSNFAPGVPGLYMGEQMRAALSQRCNSRIYQAEFGRDLKLGANGLVALTRNPQEVVRGEFVGQDILVGTYAHAGNRLSLFIRKIDSKNGVIHKMVAKEITYRCGVGSTSAVITK